MNNTAQASGRPDDMVVTRWVQEALDDSKTLKELNRVGDRSLSQLDSKLCLAMTAMLTRAGEKARHTRGTMDRFVLECSRKGRITRGRQLVHLTLENSKTVDQSGAVCCLSHLGNVNIENEDLHGLLTKWDVALDGLSGGRPQEVLLRDTLYNNIKDSPSMSDDVGCYDRLPKNRPDRSRDKLLEFVEAAIATKRQWHNFLERDALMAGKLKAKSAGISAAPAKAAPAKAAPKRGAGTACRLHFTTGQCKWGDNCRFAHTAKSDEQKKAVAKFFAKRADSSVTAAPVTPKAQEGAPQPKSEAKAKGRERSPSREPRDRAKQSPCWHSTWEAGVRTETSADTRTRHQAGRRWKLGGSAKLLARRSP